MTTNMLATYIEVEYDEYTTDRERVKNAFKELRKRGYACRMNFMCCGSCASYALHEKYDGKGKKGHVYYSRQGEDAFRCSEGGWGRGERTDRLHSNLYLSWSGDGYEIAAVLRKHGLNVEWEGSEAYCVIVKP
jgi:hypothetical protein